MDVITKSLVKDFLILNEIKTIDEATDFEKFSSHCIIANEYNANFNVDEILTDKNTMGIDGIGILVNGKLIDNKETINDLIESNKVLEATFIFIQSKTSNKFEGTEIGNFFFAVKEFFAESATIFKGEKMSNFIKLKNFIYEKSPYMKKGNPLCKLYFVTTGNWDDDSNLLTIIKRNIEEIKSSNLFSDVIFEPCDAGRIQKYYRKTQEKVSTTFSFEKRVTIPVIEGIQEAYFGITPFPQFKKVIADETDKIRSIFYDNIRDYLGNNPVNQKIQTTLKDGKFDFFSVLNNGVTIVAESLQVTGDKFTISDYQIVNGCQTSHVLFNNKDLEGIEKVYIPVRLIVTNNDDIKNDITKATNSQTEVKQEQLEALSEFQKNLEQYYNSQDGEAGLYYERRTNQYNSDSSVYKTKIISIPIQIKSFSAMFLENPHSVSGYYGTIAKRLGEKIFKKDHRYSPYYISALAYYRLESYFRTSIIDPKFKQTRYHILMLFRLLSNSDPLPEFNSKKMDAYCKKISDILNTPSKCLETFGQAIEILDKTGLDIADKDIFKSKESTDLLISQYKSLLVK